MTRTFKELLKKEGPKFFSKGMLASVVSWVPSSVIMIASYEMVKTLSLKKEAIDLFL